MARNTELLYITLIAIIAIIAITFMASEKSFEEKNVLDKDLIGHAAGGDTIEDSSGGYREKCGKKATRKENRCVKKLSENPTYEERKACRDLWAEKYFDCISWWESY